jgi:ubiquinone/menaquinone biosynthesis C-methylase UbiE
MKSIHSMFIGEEYAAYRPSYPDQLFSDIYDYHTRRHGQWGVAIDVACGSGQATIPLSQKFGKVYGLDLNPTQIAEAPRRPNIDYSISPAETLKFDSASTDLITIAQAAHWLDLPLVYKEFERVLKKDHGTLAIWCYGFCHIDDVEVEKALQSFYAAIKDFWEERRVLVNNLYRDLYFPLKDIER